MADTARNRLFLPTCATVLLALLAGGSGQPVNTLIVLLGSLPLLYLVLAEKRPTRLAGTAKLALILLAIATLQLVPLPPAIWTSLPGRNLAAQALQITGQPLGWRPLALDPGAAMAALLFVVAPLTVHVAVTRLDPVSVRKLLALVAVFALLSATIGIVQRLAGGLAIYETEHAGVALGLFANRNHHADLLVAGMLLLVALAPYALKPTFRWIATALLALLTFAIVATVSRTGMALAAAAALASLIAIWRPSRKVAPWMVLLAFAGGIAILFVPAFADIFARFGGALDDQRLTMAQDTLAATRTMWPFGSGYGSFVPVYMAHENLDMIEARYVVAAHNDYLQLALEGGLPGVVTAVAGPMALAVIAWQLAEKRAPALAWAAWGVAAALLAHSALDFPLRTPALAVLFGLCTGAAQIVPQRLRRSRR